MTAADPLVGVVILTWNGLDDTLDCLASLQETVGVRLLVVVTDNGSTDGTPRVVRERFPAVQVVENGANLGFAGGNNVGISAALDAGCDLVLVLNNDTIVPPEAIARLARTLAEHPDAAGCSPVLPYAGDPERLWFAGAHYDATRGHSGRNSAWELGTAPLPDAPVEVQRLVGAAMLIRAELIRGPDGDRAFDPELFYLHEDVDWSLRLRAGGHRLLLEPRARILHRVAASQGGEPQTPVTAYYGTRNDLALGRRWGPAGGPRLAWRQLVSFGIHVAAARSARRGQRWASVRASLEGARDLRRGQMGQRPSDR